MSSVSLGIYAHWQKSGAAASLKALLHELYAHDVHVLVEQHAAKLVGQPGHSLDELYHRVDLFVALGGDGTILRLVRDLRGKMKPVMGINFGSLGFLTCFGGPEFAVAAKALASGDYRVDERTMLEASIERERRRGHAGGTFAAGPGRSIYRSDPPDTIQCRRTNNCHCNRIHRLLAFRRRTDRHAEHGNVCRDPDLPACPDQSLGDCLQ